jgi:hypothetical protein
LKFFKQHAKKQISEPKSNHENGVDDNSSSSPAAAFRDETNDALSFLTPESKCVQLRIAGQQGNNNDLSDGSDFDAAINNFISHDYSIALERRVGILSQKNSLLAKDLADARREISSLTSQLQSLQTPFQNRFQYSSGGNGCAGAESWGSDFQTANDSSTSTWNCGRVSFGAQDVSRRGRRNTAHAPGGRRGTQFAIRGRDVSEGGRSRIFQRGGGSGSGLPFRQHDVSETGGHLEYDARGRNGRGFHDATYTSYTTNAVVGKGDGGNSHHEPLRDRKRLCQNSRQNMRYNNGVGGGPGPFIVTHDCFGHESK